jgi:hypothetical protein
MRTRIQERLRKNGMMALHRLMFAMSFATIAWISLRTIGG